MKLQIITLKQLTFVLENKLVCFYISHYDGRLPSKAFLVFDINQVTEATTTITTLHQITVAITLI